MWLHYNGNAWATSTPVTDLLMSVWAASPTAAWAVGDGVMWQWNGSAWTSVPEAGGYAVFGNSATDVWAVSNDAGSFHFDGTSWTESVVYASTWGEDLYAITGTGGVLLAAGQDGVLSRFAGGAWYRVGTANITALGGSASADVWGGSDQGYVIHWNGSAWSLGTSGVTTRFSSISAASTSLAMAGGAFGVIRWNGTAWAPAGFTQNTLSVWVAGATSAWALTLDFAADANPVFQWNGTSWTESSPGLLFGFTTIDVGGSGSDAWLVGQGGQLLHHP